MSNNNCATAAAGGTGNGGGGKSYNYSSYSNTYPNSNNNNNNQFKNNANANMATAAAANGGGGGGGGEITAGYESGDLHLTSSSFAPRDPKLDEEVKKHLQVTEPSWQAFISSIKAGKQAVAEGNEDPNLTEWSKKYLPGVHDAVVKLQKHVVDTEHFELIFCRLYDIIEIAVHGRSPKRNFDFLSNFRECNELILNVLCAFVSLRGGLYFENEQFKDQYDPSSIEFMFQLVAVNKFLLDSSPAPLDPDDPDEEQDADVPAESAAKSWKECIETLIQLKQSEFVKLRQEVIVSSQRLKSAINYVDPTNQEDQNLQLNTNGSKHQDPTSIHAIREDLRVYYQKYLLLDELDSERCQIAKLEDFFCNLRLRQRQQRGEKQSATEGKFISASHLPDWLSVPEKDVDSRTLLVTGPGGCGKTVALKHICIQQGVKDSIIVFIALKELRKTLRKVPIESVSDLLKKSARAVLYDGRVKAIVDKKKPIPVIFAFDGFDEVHNAQYEEEDENLANFLSDMIDPEKRKFSLDHGLLPDLVRSCDRVIISSREERIASSNCNLDSAEAGPLVDELAVQLWTNSEVERFCLRFFSNAFKKQHQEQDQLAKAVRTATNDVISSLTSPLMDSWRGLPLAVTLLSQLRSSSQGDKVLDNMSPARAYSLVLEMHWERSRLRVADRLLRCKTEYVHDCRKDHGIELNDGVTPQLFELVLNSAAEASFKLLSTNSNVTEISFPSSSSSSKNKLPLWAALLRETGLIRVENNNSKATFSHRSWIEFLCARHAATCSTENAIEQIPWDQSKFASVWLLLADFARSGTFEKSLSVQRFSFAVMSKYAERIKETVKEREGEKRLQLRSWNVDSENDKASISLLARITNIVKSEKLLSSLLIYTVSGIRIDLLNVARRQRHRLPKLIKRSSATCGKCWTHFSEAPAGWKCSKCNVFIWNKDTSNCEICNKSLLFSWRGRTRCCGKCVCVDCIFEKEEGSKVACFCWKCVTRAFLPVTNHASSLQDRSNINLTVEDGLSVSSSYLSSSTSFDSTLVKDSPSQRQMVAANSFILHLRWLAELCVAEGALDCFKFIEEEYPEALFGVFETKDMEFASSQILSHAVARALDHLDRRSVSACVEYIINKYNVDVQLEDAIPVNSVVGVTRAIKKIDCENYCVERRRRDDDKIVDLLSSAIGKSHLDGVAALFRCRRDEKGRFLWCHQVIPPQALHFRLKYIFPQDLQFRVWCEEKKEFETSTLSDLAKHLEIDLSSNLSREQFQIKLSEAEQHLWIPFFHLFEEVEFHKNANMFLLTPSNSPSQLRTLSLSRNNRVTHESFAVLASNCTKLEKLNLSGPRTKFQDASLKAIADSPSASSLTVTELHDGRRSFTNDGVAALVNKCHNLRSLDLSGLLSKFTDESLTTVSKSSCAQNLKIIRLNGNKNFTDIGVEALVAKCSRLEEIDVSGDTQFTDASLEYISDSSCAETLRGINVSLSLRFTDVGVSFLATKCKQLENVNLAGGSTKFTNSSLRALADSPSVSTLTSVNLSFNRLFSDEAAGTLICKCSKLEHLNVSGSMWGSITPNFTAGVSATLRFLNFSGNVHVTDGDITALTKKCENLEHIDLSGVFGKFTNSSLKAIADSSVHRNLTSINLSHSQHFTDQGVCDLVAKASKLVLLNLSGGPTQFTDHSLTAISTSPCVPALVNIDLSWNKHFTNVGIDALKRAYGDTFFKITLNVEECLRVRNI